MSLIIEDAYDVKVYVEFLDLSMTVIGIEMNSKKRFTAQFLECQGIKIEYDKTQYEDIGEEINLLTNIADGIRCTKPMENGVNEYCIGFESGNYIHIQCRKIVVMRE